MKLLYIHAYPLDSDMANCVQVISMCKEFSKLQDVFLLSPPTTKSEKEMKAYLKKNYDLPDSVNLLFFKNYPFNRRVSQFVNYFNVNRYVKMVKPDFCFVRNSMFLRGCVRSKVPTFYEVHNNILHPRFKFINFCLKKMLIRSSKSSKLIRFITISNSLKDYWTNLGVHKSKILVLHSGFNTKEFEKTLSKAEARSLTNLPINKKIAIYTGSLLADRKIENILFLAEQNKDVLFVIAGGPEHQKNYYESLSNKQHLNNVKFLGHISHQSIPNYLFSADILLAFWSTKVPTINYCSPLKVFEYMAAGRLILAHGFPTIKEVLIDKVNAYLADPEDLQQLDNKLKIALNDKKGHIISNLAKKDAFEKYSWSVRVDRIINEFNEYRF
jgi:glycosyltransferase involved in cell wall biosynthesis